MLLRLHVAHGRWSLRIAQRLYSGVFQDCLTKRSAWACFARAIHTCQKRVGPGCELRPFGCHPQAPPYILIQQSHVPSLLSHADFLLLQRVCFGQQYSRGCAKSTDTSVLPHLARIGGSDVRVDIWSPHISPTSNYT